MLTLILVCTVPVLNIFICYCTGTDGYISMKVPYFFMTPSYKLGRKGEGENHSVSLYRTVSCGPCLQLPSTGTVPQERIQGGGAGGGRIPPPSGWGGAIFFKISKYMRKRRVL